MWLVINRTIKFKNDFGNNNLCNKICTLILGILSSQFMEKKLSIENFSNWMSFKTQLESGGTSQVYGQCHKVICLIMREVIKTCKLR